MHRQKFLQARIVKYREDPVLFFIEVLHFHADEWQKAVAIDIAHHPRVTVRSGQGVGKTALEAAIALWFLCCFPNARVVATAPTRQQLHDVLWSELAKWMDKSPILNELLTWTKTRITVKGREKRWFMVARTATKPANMQGFHADNMLFIVDEASGVDDPILEAILGTLSGPNNNLGLFGNPNQPSGIFYDSHTRDRDIYCVHQISSLDSPLTNKEVIEANMRKYGKDSNFIRVRVLGEFPLAEDDVFIPLPLLEKSKDTQYNERPAELIHIGCDVARYGDDKTIIGYKVNEKVELPHKDTKQDTMKTAAKIVQLGEELRAKQKFDGIIPIKVDDGGVGGGVVDRLRQIKKSNPTYYYWMRIIPVAFGRPINHRYYHDSTTLMMSIVKTLLQPFDEDGKAKPVELIIPNDSELIAQLSCRKYELNERSKIVVESKKAMKARGLPSPDEADCLLLLCLPVNTEKKAKKNERR